MNNCAIIQCNYYTMVIYFKTLLFLSFFNYFNKFFRSIVCDC